MKILITGGAGFIGSNLILHWIKKNPQDEILNIDTLTYAADLANLDEVQQHPSYSFTKLDITARAGVRNIIREFQPDGVIHLAAESHVDNSIVGPEPFVLTNVVGTFHLLEECRQLWSEEKKTFSEKRFHHVSTDEVYGTLNDEGKFTEETRYSPNSPYSASKAGSDHLVRAYHHTYGMNTVITNCSNNFGPRQHREKFIPTIIRTALAGKPIPVYGKGENIRDWLFVGDHCQALDLVFHKSPSGETYNIGGDNEWKNIDVVKKVCTVLNEEVGSGTDGDYSNLVSFVDDRQGQDYRYAIDARKIHSELGWKSSGTFDEHLRATIRWYIKKFQ